MSIVISLLLSFSCSLDHRDLPSFPTRRSSDLCQEVTPDLVVFRQEVFDDFLSHEPVILRRSGRMDLDNRPIGPPTRDRKSTRLNSSHTVISYAVFCLKKKKNRENNKTPEKYNV